ncbi:MAG: hypothetical protein OMM_06160 [Candidatus Magnetoglobus multicellularis str. Araruama]|uniref:Uncharacterized protein n=1 Tax=Candidatus Magnetoglobus multicellularis str. Araruama TaxID=890399 RepID=A0A1V1NQT7_9BACT|nr:MAG: hypothetical protein OMM_06160 [Candidatus Magnetoglobus multicellularis str. Araruama]
MCVNKNILWLGTEKGLWGINFLDKKIFKHFTDKDGLNTNRIMSVVAQNNKILVSSYSMLGAVDLPHRMLRRGDLVGEGLNQIDLATNKIKNIKLPQEDCGLVSMYKSSNNYIRMVLYKRFPPYKIYDYADSNKFTFVPSCYHHLDRIFKEHEIHDGSEEAAVILDFMSQVYFKRLQGAPQYITTEIIDIFEKIKSIKNKRFVISSR